MRVLAGKAAAKRGAKDWRTRASRWRRSSRRYARLWPTCAEGRRPRLLAKYARKWDGLQPGQPAAGCADGEFARPGRRPVARIALRARAGRGETSAGSANGRSPQEWMRTRRRHFARPTSAAAGVGGMLCAGRTVSAAFDAADDGDSGAGGRGKRRFAWFRRSRGPKTLAAAANAGREASFIVSAARRRLRHWRMARRAFRAWTRLLAREICTSPPPRRWWRSIARLIFSPGQRKW